MLRSAFGEANDHGFRRDRGTGPLMGSRAEGYLDAVYGAKSREELRRLYDDWAAHYDEDVTGFGYAYPALMAGLVGRHVRDPAARLLDAGCGTGLIGSMFRALGYTNLAGLDLSAGMLERARGRGIYQELLQGVLGEPLALASDRFDAVVCAGVLTLGHARPDSLDELIRVTRPGGLLIFTLSAPVYFEHGFKDRLDALQAAGRIRELERSGEIQALPGAPAEAALRCRGHVFEVL